MKAKHNIPMVIVFFSFTLFCMVMIFLFSVQSGESSAQESMSIYDLFIKFTGFDFISHNAFRKFAHFAEYAALGFGFSGTLFFINYTSHPKFSLLLSALYAVSDEVHQYFVPERACRFFDFCVDCGGALFGIVIFMFIKFVLNKLFYIKKEGKTLD